MSSQAGCRKENVIAGSGPSGDGPSGLVRAIVRPEGLCPHRPDAARKM